MKAIAEYFRDLAAGDRFFGAEPPQPDADMLHKIAEQTIQSRVNAEVTDNSLILRQDHSAASAVPIAAAAPVAQAPTQTAAPDTAEAAPAVSEPEITEPSKFADGESIAAKLQRIRAVVSRETAEPAEVTSSYAEDEHAEELADKPTAPAAAPIDDYEDEEDAAPIAELQPAEPEAAEPVAEVDVEPELEAEAEVEAEAELEAEVEAEIEEEAEATQEEAVEETAVDASEQDAPQELDTADLIAKLGGTDHAEEQSAADPSELETEVASDEAEAEAEAEEVVAEDTAAEEDVAEEATAEDATREATDEDSTANEDAVSALLADADTDDVSQGDAEPEQVKPRRRIIVQKVSRAEVEAAQSQDSAEADPAPSAELDAEAEAALMRELAAVEADMEPEVVETSETPAEDDDMEARALAAAQAAQDAADANAKAEAEAAEKAEVEAKAAADAKAEEEADALAKVMAEAAEVEAEAKTEEAEVAEETETEAPREEDDNRAARIARRAALVEDEDAALNRLMDATSTRLSDDDEGAVRRASIAHLKAAVAATKADDSIAQAAADEEEREMDQYRSDLARVVRPGRARPRSEGTSTSRPSPLVLVSEQRIDAPETDGAAAAALDVRPRRITSGNLALQEELEEEGDENLFQQPDVESFGEYAARYAALELPDLLEAAAAHYTYVEGTPNFTRPMLMRKIAAITVTEAPSREAGLRSFGSLLREGKIVKGDDGKFVISGKSRFTPEAQEAGE